MSYQKERDRFISQAAKAGLSDDQIAGVLRHASTLQRLAVAQCNGDWPADNGQRKTAVCPLCESAWVSAVIKATGCPDCRVSAAVARVLAGGPLVARFRGDPRGYVVHLYPVDTSRDDIDSGRVWGISVPAKER